jgi:hypothetical protein
VPAELRRRQALCVGSAALVLVTAAAFTTATRSSRGTGLVNPHLPWHAARLDAAGNLQPWYRPRSGRGYDHVLRVGWRFIERRVPADPRTGRKVYLGFAVFDARTRHGTYWQHDPASLYASFVDSLAPWYAYSRDRRAVAVVREMLDYQLAHGTTPAGWSWPRVPFATSCAGDVDYGRCLAGMPRSFYGGTEPDKIGLLGLGYARFYELTGDRAYLRAAVRAAAALARHVRRGDAAHSPWAFRVDARTGHTLEHAEYGGMVVAPVRLFDELIRLHAGDTAAFARARELAWHWLLRYPLNPASDDWNRWSGHYEDIDYDADDLNQASPTMTALYLLMRSDPATIDPHWRAHARALLAWVRSYLGHGPFSGAWAIDEQRTPARGSFACCSPAGLGSDTARWAAANLLLADRTSDRAARTSARHSLAYATYFMRSDGAVSCCGADYPQSYWFSDGYGDYLKSFSWALAADPRLAPPHEDHILSSTSVVQAVRYRPRRVVYRTFAARSVEVLRLSFVPTRAVAGGRTLRRRPNVRRQGYTVQPLSGGDVVVRVRHDDARRIAVE